jgi:glutathione S-transferase
MLTLEKRRQFLADKVKVVLAEAQIAPSLMAKELARILDIGISQAYRKLNGHTDYTLPQVSAIETAFGVELLHVFESGTMQAKVLGRGRWTPADLAVGLQVVRCNIIVGLAWREPARRAFAAYVARGQWRVCPAGEYTGSEPLFEVDELNYSAKDETAEAV